MIQARKSLLFAGSAACLRAFAVFRKTIPYYPRQQTRHNKRGSPLPAKPTVADKVKSSKKLDGLFTLYQDTATGSVQMYVKKNQLGKEYIYQSFSMGGPTSLFLNQNMIRTTWVIQNQKEF